MKYLAIFIVAHIFFESVLGNNSSKYTFFVSVKQQDHSLTISGHIRHKHIKANRINYKLIPGVPKKTIHCLISSNVKPLKAISIK